MKDKTIKSICIALIVSAALFVQSAFALDISSKGACVMDYDTGNVLYELDGNALRSVASMSKIMNMYCVYEAIENGEISLDTIVPVSENVYQKSRIQNSFWLYYNTKYTVDEMLDAMIVRSSNGAAVAMAELLGNGSEAEFVKKMNDKAREMGLDAVFYDSYGMLANKMTPIAMAVLARNIIHDYPDVLIRSAKKSIDFHSKVYLTTNLLLTDVFYEGADGLKSGTTNEAGPCFCATAMRDNKRLITVSMASSSDKQRFIDSTVLLDYGFSVLDQKYKHIFFTDMKTFINGAEIPTFAYNGDVPHAVIVAEDLRNYGFDVSWNQDDKVLYLEHNIHKKHMPMALDYYKNKNGQKAYRIYTDSTARVKVNYGGNIIELCDIYDVNGYICISVDEFRKLNAFTWNAEKREGIISL